MPPSELLEGVGQFNRREFFLCHETLEELWKRERAPIRDLYRGVLQVAVGCYHLQRLNARGALYSFEHGIVRLRAFAPVCQRVDVSHLIGEAQVLVDLLLAEGPSWSGEFDRRLIPTIRLTSERSLPDAAVRGPS